MYEEDLYQLILHEVGHTLGLNHNFAASTLHDNNDIHNPDITYQEGLSSSVMDYHALNIAPLGVQQGQYADIKPGKYDVLAIKYAYTPNLTKKDLRSLLEEHSSPEYLFGSNVDVSEPTSIPYSLLISKAPTLFSFVLLSTLSYLA